MQKNNQSNQPIQKSINLNSMALKVENNQLFILDQRQLPQNEIWIIISHPDVLIECIQNLAIRGAPLIGVSAALGLALFLQKNKLSKNETLILMDKIGNARPTAINLLFAVNQLKNILEISHDKEDFSSLLLEAALKIYNEDHQLCEDIAKMAQAYIQDGDVILHQCNTGSLATVGRGTALGAITYAWEMGKKISVVVLETRPLGQGARLTTWELDKHKIPYTLICDNMAAAAIKHFNISKIFVGADRITKNGDVANKIGTFQIGILAKYFQIPLYVCAPYSTFDNERNSGSEIQIEERNPFEIQHIWGCFQAKVWNPAFDVIPHELITKIVTNFNATI